MTESVSPSAPTPEETQRYQEDFQKSLSLFQKSFEEYNRPGIDPHKKEQFKKVLDETLQIMNQTANAALSQAKQKKEASLNTDYEMFLTDPSSQNREKIVGDIQDLQR